MKYYITLLALFCTLAAGCAHLSPSADFEAANPAQPAAAADNMTAAPGPAPTATPAEPAGTPDLQQQQPVPAVPAAAPAPQAASVPVPIPLAPWPAAAPSGEKISLNFDNADIYEVINALADFLDINFIVDPAVKGRVNIHTSTEIDRSQLLPIFETIFEMNNIALVKFGSLYKIVPIKEAKEEIVDISIGRQMAEPPSYDRVMIQIVPLQYVAAKEVVKVLKPFTGKRGELIGYDAGNLLIIVETAATVHKLLRIINIIDADTFAHNSVSFFKIQNADVNDMAKELESIFSSIGIDKAPEKGVGLSFIPIERVSCILAVSSIPGIFEKVQHWIDILDTVDTEAEEQVFIYFVENGKADEIAEVLNKVYGEGKSEKKTVRKTTSRTTKTKTKAKTPEAAQAAGVLEGEIKIVTDESTNSIILKATPHDYSVIRATIQKIDIVPKQVLIEVLIAEVALSGDTEFGVEWSLLGTDASIGGYKGQDKVGVDFGTGGLGTDLATNLGRGFTYRFSSARLEAFLVAQASKNKLNILSSPHILAADNKEARIEVGKEVPIVTSEYVPQDIEQNTATSRSIEYRSTGVILSVTPRINEKGLVAMEVSQEVSEAKQTTTSGIQSPEISNRKAETSLVVMDGETIVIGGLIEDSKTKTLTGVPFLSSIPLIGYLFSSTKDTVVKTELIILITPHVVHNINEAELVTKEFQQKLWQVEKLIKKSDDYWKDYK